MDSYPILNFETLRLLIPDDLKNEETVTNSEYNNASERFGNNSNLQAVTEVCSEDLRSTTPESSYR